MLQQTRPPSESEQKIPCDTEDIKLLTVYVKQSVGQSHSSYLRQGAKLIAQAKVTLNTFRGLSSVVGSGVGIVTSFGGNHVKKNVFRW